MEVRTFTVYCSFAIDVKPMHLCGKLPLLSVEGQMLSFLGDRMIVWLA